MALAGKCDRCKTLFTLNEKDPKIPRIKILKADPFYNCATKPEKLYDLCDECYKKLNMWLKVYEGDDNG